MNSPLGQRIDQGVRHLLPALTTLFLIFSGVIAWPIPYIGALTPSFGLMGVYYWAIHRPDLFRPLVVFLFGLLQDSLQGLPLGLSSFLFVATYQVVLSQRRFFTGQIFPMLWFGFFLVSLINTVIESIMIGMVTGHHPGLFAPLVQSVFTILIFPLPAYVLIRIQRVFLPVR